MENKNKNEKAEKDHRRFKFTRNLPRYLPERASRIFFLQKARLAPAHELPIGLAILPPQVKERKEGSDDREVNKTSQLRIHAFVGDPRCTYSKHGILPYKNK